MKEKKKTFFATKGFLLWIGLQCAQRSTNLLEVLPGHDIVSKSNTIMNFISLKKTFFCVACASIGTVFEVFGKKGWTCFARETIFNVLPFAFHVFKKRNFHKVFWKKRFLIFGSQRLRGQCKTSNSFPQNWAFQQETKGLVWTKKFYPPRDCLVSFFTSKRFHWFAWEKEKFHFNFFAKIFNF